jgi:hypothetical protein
LEILMKKFFPLLFSLCLLALPLSAQESSGSDEVEETVPEDEYSAPPLILNAAGDMTLTLEAGAGFPLAFSTPDTAKHIWPGFYGNVTFDYSLTPFFYVGASFQGLFSSTIANNSLNTIPLSFHAGYKFVFDNLEIPLSLGLGAYLQTYTSAESYTHFSLFMKAQTGVYWRFNSSWAIGLDANLWWTPQWVSGSGSAQGLFIAPGASFRFYY